MRSALFGPAQRLLTLFRPLRLLKLLDRSPWLDCLDWLDCLKRYDCFSCRDCLGCFDCFHCFDCRHWLDCFDCVDCFDRFDLSRLLRLCELVATAQIVHAKIDASCAETRDRTGDFQVLSLTLSQLSYRDCCEGQGALTALGPARRSVLCRCAASGWPSSGAWKN